MLVYGINFPCAVMNTKLQSLGQLFCFWANINKKANEAKEKKLFRKQKKKRQSKYKKTARIQGTC